MGVENTSFIAIFQVDVSIDAVTGGGGESHFGRDGVNAYLRVVPVR